MKPVASRKRIRRAVARVDLPCPRCRAEIARSGSGPGPCQGGASGKEMAAAAKAYADLFASRLHTELQALHRAAGLSVYKLAQRTGLDRQTLGPIVKGVTKPTPHSMARIAYVLFGGMAGWGRHFDAVLRSVTEKRQP